VLRAPNKLRQYAPYGRRTSKPLRVLAARCLKRYVLKENSSLRASFYVLLLVFVSACSSTQMRGVVEDGSYHDSETVFAMDVPKTYLTAFDGRKTWFSYVDFVTNSGAYSIEFFDRAGAEDVDSFVSGTPSFMEGYIPDKCGPNSFEMVEGEFSEVSGESSYDFLTQGIRPNGQLTFLYGRSIFLAKNKVAICMLFENRIHGENVDDFNLRFDKIEFDRVCSSIRPRT